MSIFRSDQSRRSVSGTSLGTAWAKSPFSTTASVAMCCPPASTPIARLPAKAMRSTAVFRRNSTPIRSATRCIAPLTAPQPPRGWNTP